MSNARLERRLNKAQKQLEEIERISFSSEEVRREYLWEAVARVNGLQAQYDNRVRAILAAGAR